jgi:LuxR family transcriptional regulator, maltose regulon positive regulatory protein
MQQVQKAGNTPLPLKTTPPNLRKVIGRERLFDLLNAPPLSPLSWISGPAGFGKTTLVKTYLDGLGRPFLWYKIDSRDLDLLTFFHFFGKMISAHFQKTGEVLPRIVKELPFNFRTFGESILSSIKHPLSFVFDNFQDAPNDSPIADAVKVLLDQIPTGVSFIFISREEPPPFFARFQAYHGMKRIGGKELRLSLPEAVQIARRRGHRLPKDTIAEILECSNGWAAGFTLLLESMRQEGNRGCRGEVKPRIIFDYFAELLEKISPECREFLLKTSFLPFLTPTNTEQLRTDNLSHCILDQLCNDNLFIERIVGSGERYAYHPLFQEFLQKQAMESFTPYQLRENWRRCGLIIAEEDPEAAMELFRRAEAWEGLDKLINQLGPTLVGTGKLDALVHLTSDIPPGAKEQLPWLRYWSAVAMMANDPDKARAEFEITFASAERAGQWDGMMLSWCGIVESIGISKTKLSELDGWIARMETLLTEVAGFPSPAIHAHVTFAMTVAFVLRSRDHRAIERWSRETLCIIPGPEVLLSQAHVLRQLVIHSFWKGRIEQGVHYLTILKQRAAQPHSPQLIKLQYRAAETAYCMFKGNYEQCLQTVSEGLQFAEESGIHGLDALFHGFAALSALDRGEIEQAEHFASTAKTCFHAESMIGESLHAMIRARTVLLRGCPDEANRILEAACRLMELKDHPILLGCMHLISANTFLSMGNFLKVREHLLKARQAAVITESEFILFLSDMCAAQMALDQADQNQCRSLLTLALQRGRTQGLHYHLVDHPAGTARLLAFAIDEGIEPEYVGQIVRKRQLVPTESSTEREGWPWLYRIRTIGGFSIEREGHPLSFSGKVPQRPLTLLKLLICHGGRSVPEHLLTESLWPDAEGDHARSAFSTTLGRLRRLLGEEKALLYSERQLTLNPNLCWVDLWSFEREVEKIRLFESDLSSISPQLARVFELYKGPFLPGEKNEQDYAQTRERLSRKFELVVLRLVGQLENAERYEEAIEMYERCLEREPIVESFYEAVMRCYKALNMKRKARDAFNRCRMVLSRTVGIAPSSRMIDLKRSI